MSVYRWLGISSVAMGPKGLTSAGEYMGALTTIENIIPDSATFLVEMPDETELYVEDSCDPDVVVATGGSKKSIEFATADMDLTTSFLAAFGGTVSGTVFSFSSGCDTLREKCVQAVTNAVNGKTFLVRIPNALIRTSADLKMYNRNPVEGQINFTFTAQRAITSGGTIVAPVQVVKSS